MLGSEPGRASATACLIAASSCAASARSWLPSTVAAERLRGFQSTGLAPAGASRIVFERGLRLERRRGSPRRGLLRASERRPRRRARGLVTAAAPSGGVARAILPFGGLARDDLGAMDGIERIAVGAASGLSRALAGRGAGLRRSFLLLIFQLALEGLPARADFARLGSSSTFFVPLASPPSSWRPSVAALSLPSLPSGSSRPFGLGRLSVRRMGLK